MGPRSKTPSACRQTFRWRSQRSREQGKCSKARPRGRDGGKHTCADGRVIQNTPANAVETPTRRRWRGSDAVLPGRTDPGRNHAQHREGSKDARRPPSGEDSPPRVATRRGVAQTRPCGDRARQGGLPGRGKITQVHRAGGWMVRTRDATRRTPGDPVVQGRQSSHAGTIVSEGAVAPGDPQRAAHPPRGFTSRSRRFENSMETGEMES